MEAVIVPYCCQRCGGGEHETDDSGRRRCTRCKDIRSREWNLKKRYGITVEDYERIYRKQRGKCGICRIKSEDGSNLDVDHDHKTGDVRGLLCGACNLGLGKFKDNIRIVRRAVEYLNSSNL